MTSEIHRLERASQWLPEKLKEFAILTGWEERSAYITSHAASIIHTLEEHLHRFSYERPFFTSFDRLCIREKKSQSIPCSFWTLANVKKVSPAPHTVAWEIQDVAILMIPPTKRDDQGRTVKQNKLLGKGTFKKWILGFSIQITATSPQWKPCALGRSLKDTLVRNQRSSQLGFNLQEDTHLKDSPYMLSVECAYYRGIEEWIAPWASGNFFFFQKSPRARLSFWKGTYFAFQELDFMQRLKILAELSEGLSFLHAKRLVHFDLKENNVLLVYAEGSFHPKIADPDFMGYVGTKKMILSSTDLQENYWISTISAKGCRSFFSDVFGFAFFISSISLCIKNVCHTDNQHYALPIKKIIQEIIQKIKAFAEHSTTPMTLGYIQAETILCLLYAMVRKANQLANHAITQHLKEKKIHTHNYWNTVQAYTPVMEATLELLPQIIPWLPDIHSIHRTILQAVEFMHTHTEPLTAFNLPQEDTLPFPIHEIPPQIASIFYALEEVEKQQTEREMKKQRIEEAEQRQMEKKPPQNRPSPLKETERNCTIL